MAMYLKVVVVVVVINFGIISEMPGMCFYFSRCKV